MNDKYNQPTAHMLQPVKGWDSMAHLDFVAPIASRDDDIVALPGTVMHLNANGELEAGLTAQSMGMYLFYKQNDEDVQPYPLTADGTQMTAVGMQSFGGYNSEMYLRHNWATEKADFYNTNGTASNVGPFNYNATGATKSVEYTKGTAAHTTYPAICGMELSSTEFAAKMGDGTSIGYAPNDTLTAPLKTTVFDAGKPGSRDQQLAGGFLKKGACYIDPICGIVSKKPVINEHGYKQICFWSTWLPAITKNTANLGDGSTLKVTANAELVAGGPNLAFEWVNDAGISLTEAAKVSYKLADATTFTAWTTKVTTAASAAAGFNFVIKLEPFTGSYNDFTVSATYDGAAVSVAQDKGEFTVSIAADDMAASKDIVVTVASATLGVAATAVYEATTTA